MSIQIHDLATEGAHRVLKIHHEGSGLLAFLVLDDLRLGPAAGGVRTRTYPDERAALADARSLASAMTLKCAISGLNAGGGKTVVMAHPRLQRREAFRRLGEVIESLGGSYRTAGDVGTTRQDLETMGEVCSWVHSDESDLARSVARGVLAALRGAEDAVQAPLLAQERAAVQGVGSVGAEVVRSLAAAGVRVTLSDLDAERARRAAEAAGATVCPPESIWRQETELLIPCALGGVIRPEHASHPTARLVCGGANNVLSSPEVERTLTNAGLVFVPDFISSAGGVIDGIGETVMGLDDRGPLIDALQETAYRVVAEARRSGATASEVARSEARRRLAGSGSGR